MFTYILYPLLFIPVYIYKKFTKNKVLVTYEQKCDDEFVFTYNYGHNNELYEKLTDLNVNDYDHLIINDDIEKRRFEIVVKFKKSNTCNHDSCKDEELDDSKSYEGDIHESKKDNNEDVQSSVGDSEENAKQYLKENVVTFNVSDFNDIVKID